MTTKPGNRRVWMTDVRMQSGEGRMYDRVGEGGNITREGTGVHYSGRIVLTLETATTDPRDVTVGEILRAVKDWCMTADPDTAS